MSEQARRSLPPPPLGTGPPTDEEVAYYYPPNLSWETVKDQVGSGDLGVLKRHPALQDRYGKWTRETAAQHGSIIRYLVNHRLGWGPTESRPATPGSHAEPTYTDEDGRTTPKPGDNLPTPPPTRPFTPNRSAESTQNHESEPHYFTADIPSKFFKVLINDWPYSIPLNVRHFVVWSRVPIIHPAIVPSSIWKRIEYDGLWGFTGSQKPANCVEEANHEAKSGEHHKELALAHREMDEFVRNQWKEEEWETAWFVNPPRLQSIPGVAHGHVFARKKTNGKGTTA